MRIALIAPPFICVPPKMYGGTELFVANLADQVSLISDFLEDPSEIQDALRKAYWVNIKGTSSLYDAIIWACRGGVKSRRPISPTRGKPSDTRFESMMSQPT